MHAISQIRLTFKQDRPILQKDLPEEHDDDSAGGAVQDAPPAFQAPPGYPGVWFNAEVTPLGVVVGV
ncbi:ATP-dependent Clp protease adaptor ClpS, partial [Pseudomonas sp. NPDC087598]